MEAELVVASDAAVLQRHLEVSLAYALSAGALALTVATSERGMLDHRGLTLAAMVALLILVVSETTTWRWRRRVLSTRYVVEAGRLRAEVDGEPVLDVACADVFLLRVEGRVGWMEVVAPLAADDLPRVVLRTELGITGPPVALWADDVYRAEAALLAAIKPYRDGRRRAAGLD